ncbi:MAG TPA: CDP-alcohol phosphatidyltransferase family protein [Ktedonobacterales bacterium]|jgi:phosphatidylglycerophosphate synthase|nr:CDP-alcohol phosphatidyltransferase family protein [Ktedonobacterales bacterium]
MTRESGIRLTAIQATWLLAVVIGVPLGILTMRDFGDEVALRFAAYLVIACLLWTLLLAALRRRAGPEPNRWATLLTLSRLVTGCALAAFVLSGARDRMQTAAIVMWILVVLTATLSDWFDGALGRREGPTRFASSLDIESDSWLTLWSAMAAILLGGLPWICLLPPVVRYIHPLLALRAGKLPVGGGPWWSRVTGMTQMAVLMAGFAPIAGPARDAILGIIIWPVSLAQLATMLALLALRRERQEHR